MNNTANADLAINQTLHRDPNGAALQTVDPNALVSDQLQGLLASDSPYIAAARAQGEQAAASRGLLNSSMAGGLAENSAIANALPIAQGNASEYAGVSAANQQAKNQLLGENIAARAQMGSAASMANASMYNADVQAKIAAAAQKQQYQEFGMNLGYQYAGLTQQGSQFEQSLAQHGDEFNASQGQQLAEFNKSQQDSLTMFSKQENMQQGEFMAGMDWNKYSLGAQMQMQNNGMYANMFGAIMMNPNMTGDDRKAALSNAHDFFSQFSQQSASLPAFTPPWVADPSYWTRDWSGG